MIPESETAARCSDPLGRELLFRYSAKEASEFEQRSFERHMLECDLCYQDFLAIWRVGELVETWPENVGSPVDSDSAEVLPQAVGDTPKTTRSGTLRAIGWTGLGLALGLVLGHCS